ncbi:MAG: hypothetical protein RIS35_3381 [Pseudomonadota bacterium]|jgi:hypothetical protein
MSPPRLTIAIPLYRGRAWLRNVASTIARLPVDARIVLSDEVGSDDAPSLLARRFANDARIVVRVRRGPPGWREHCNALIAENESPLFALLPQDDTIAPGHYEALVAALTQAPDAGMAFGQLIAEHQDGRRVEHPPPSIELGRSLPWIEAVLLERVWNLGIPFRAVIHREVLTTIPGTPGDAFADQVWVFGMALRRHLLHVPEAVYLKRYHAQNTHGHWTPPTGAQRRLEMIERVRQAFPDEREAAPVIGFIDQTMRLRRRG